MVKATLAKEVNNTIEYIYPKTSADLVEYSSSQTVEQKIQSIDSTISTMDARITNLSSTTVSGNVATDATLEVTDIRLGADGTVYNSAGESVRSQITQLSNDMNFLSDDLFSVNTVSGEREISKSGLLGRTLWGTTGTPSEEALNANFSTLTEFNNTIINDNYIPLDNLTKKKDFILYDGYITGDGSINTNNNNQEVYTEKIFIGHAKKLILNITYNENNSNNWFAYAIYNKNKEFIKRSRDYINDGYIIISDDDCRYIAFIYRNLEPNYKIEISSIITNSLSDQFKKYLLDTNTNEYSNYFKIGDIGIDSNGIKHKKHNMARIYTPNPIWLNKNDKITLDKDIHIYMYAVDSNDVNLITDQNILEQNWINYNTNHIKQINLIDNSDNYRVLIPGYYFLVVARYRDENYNYDTTPELIYKYELLNKFKIYHDYSENIIYSGEFKFIKYPIFVNGLGDITSQNKYLYEKCIVFKFLYDITIIDFYSNNHKNIINNVPDNIHLPNSGYINYCIYDNNFSLLETNNYYIQNTIENNDYNIYFNLSIDKTPYKEALYCAVSFRTFDEPYKLIISEYKSYDNVKLLIDEKINNIYNNQSIAIDYILYDGFIRGDGSIASQEKNQYEKYTDFIEIEDTDYLIELDYGNDYDMWICTALYDKNKIFIENSRRKLASNDGNRSFYNNIIHFNNPIAKYFKVTFRSFNIENCLSIYKIIKDKLINSYSFYMPSKTVKLIAHRGNDIDAPQCTAPAYVLARKLGFEINENDVFNSSDNELVCWHDINLARININENLKSIEGYDVYIDNQNNCYYYDTDNEILYEYDNNDYMQSQENINNLTLMNGYNYSVTDIKFKDLKRFDFGYYKGEQFKGTQILSFEEWVLLSKQLGMEIYIDRKNNWTAETVMIMYNILKKHSMRDKTSWINISIENATILKNLYSKFRFGTLSNPTNSLFETWQDFKEDTSGRGGFFFNPNGKTLTKQEVQLAIDNGYEIECWYVDITSIAYSDIITRIRELVEMGISGLTIDKYRLTDAYVNLYNKYNL